MVSNADPLQEGTAHRLTESFIELRLPDQKDADEFFFSRFQIRKEADFLEQIKRKLVRLVNDQYKASVTLLTLHQEGLEGHEKLGLCLELHSVLKDG